MHWVTDSCVQIWKNVGRKLLKTVQAMTTFRTPLTTPWEPVADPLWSADPSLKTADLMWWLSDESDWLIGWLVCRSINLIYRLIDLFIYSLVYLFIGSFWLIDGFIYLFTHSFVGSLIDWLRISGIAVVSSIAIPETVSLSSLQFQVSHNTSSDF